MICSGLYGGTRSLQHIMTRVLSRLLKVVQKEANASIVSGILCLLGKPECRMTSLWLQFSFRELRKWSRTLLAVAAGGIALWKNRVPHVMHMAGVVTSVAFGYDLTHISSRAIKALKGSGRRAGHADAVVDSDARLWNVSQKNVGISC